MAERRGTNISKVAMEVKNIRNAIATVPPVMIAHFLFFKGRDAAAIPITMALSPLRARSIKVMLRNRRMKSQFKKLKI